MRAGSSGSTRERAVAAAWVLRLQEHKWSTRAVIGCGLWMSRHASSMRAFASVCHFLQAPVHALELHWPTCEELSADEYDGEIPVVAWLSSRKARS